jgi:hypothetical protein
LGRARKLYPRVERDACHPRYCILRCLHMLRWLALSLVLFLLSGECLLAYIHVMLSCTLTLTQLCLRCKQQYLRDRDNTNCTHVSHAVAPYWTVGVTAQQLHYATFLGGVGEDSSFQHAVGSDGRVYIAGATSSWNFPTKMAYQSGLAGASDVYLVILHSNGECHIAHKWHRCCIWHVVAHQWHF